jgi:uncharacterized phage protein gp47/JayE
MSSFGVVSTGFAQKLLADIKDEIEAQQRADISPGLNQSATSVLGQLNGIFAAKLAEIWEVLEAVYRSIDADSATGEALDDLCLLTGLIRLPTTKSTATITATGTPTTALPAGRVVSVNGNAVARFTTLADAVIASVSAWVNTTSYALGDRVKNSSKVYQCITAGTSAGSGGPTTTAANIIDGTVHWRYLGAGTGAVDILAEAENFGPTVATSGTLTIIQTPVSGWSNAINVLDATVGRDVELDAALRLRRAASLQTSGSGAVDAIRGDVIHVSGVTQAFVFENVTDATDGDGLPPHSFETVVLGGAANALAQVIWDSKPAGIATYGGTSGTAVDAAGANQTINFSRPTSVNIYHVINVKIDAAKFPGTGDADIKAQLIAYGASLTVGDDVVASAQIPRIFDNVSGVLDVTVLQGTAPAPATSATIVIGSRELAIFDTSRMTINHV